MAAVLSSPMTTRATHMLAGHYDLLDQPPSSPNLKHEDLPAEFGDQSFGSSMSLGSSFELNRLAGTAKGDEEEEEGTKRSTISTANTSEAPGRPRSSTLDRGATGSAVVLLRQQCQVVPSRRSPPHGTGHDSLGAAMGTILNSKSPGLAAKMSSPQYMDMSPLPPSNDIARGTSSTQDTPLKPKRQSSHGSGSTDLPPGSAMKEDTPVAFGADSSKAVWQTNDDEKTTQLGGGSLGRLFGTELSSQLQQRKINTIGAGGRGLGAAGNRASLGCVFGGNGAQLVGVSSASMGSELGDESFGSPDKEPPAKRRPASLPLSHGNPLARPSLRSAGMGPPSNASNPLPRPRPNLLKSMTTGHTLDSATAERFTNFSVLRAQHRASDSAVPTNTSFALGRPGRSRSGSTERLPDGTSTDRLLLKSSSPNPLHPTIIESPSPSKDEQGSLAGYFFDPQSPDALRSAGPSSKSTSQPKARQSSLTSALASSRPRVMEKAATSAALPTSSMLGKRANPYAKRAPGISNSLEVAAAKDSNASKTSSSADSSRLRVPAPRRCQSALDNSAAFMMAGAALAAASLTSDDSGLEDMSLSSIDAGDLSIDASPSMQRSRHTATAATTIRLPPGFDASGSPIASGVRKTSRPSLFRQTSKDDSSPLGYGKRFAAAQDGERGLPTLHDDECGSPRAALRSSATASGGEAEHLPGFGASEREGKILPCFNVKDDGLMRITADTLCEVLNGSYNDQIESYQIVDCRFGYEFDGGHIPGAVNLGTLDKVKRHFLPSTSSLLAPSSCDDGASMSVPAVRPPARSQSGKPDAFGTVRKRVLIFHCEFSLKRAPSSALALRQADRALAQDYPNCHYPELYVLQGGYAGFFRRFGPRCEPQAYIAMDDPLYQERRSIELNGFRKQFARHRSFTYGDARQAHSDGMLLQAHHNHRAPQQQTHNPVHGRSGLSRVLRDDDSNSFDTSGGDSPCTTQADALQVRRCGMARHATTMNALGSAPAYTHGGPAAAAAAAAASSRASVKPILRRRDGDDDADSKPAPTCVGDLSFDSSCSIVGEDDTSTSFEAGASDSPCAVAGAAQTRRLPALAPGPAFRLVVGSSSNNSASQGHGGTGSQRRSTRPGT